MTDELNVLAGAYALDALDGAERAVFEEHLEECLECTDEVRGMRITAAELSRTTETAPPPQLRADILAAVSRVRPAPPRLDNVVALHRARAARSVWQLTAAACALIAIAVAGWGYSQHQDARRATTAQASSVSRLLGASDLAARTTAVDHGQATVMYSKSQHQIVLVGHGLSSPGNGKTYQLWMIPSAGNAISAGVFEPDSTGNVELPVSGNLNGIPKMGISVEPAGGSTQPDPKTVQLLDL